MDTLLQPFHAATFDDRASDQSPAEQNDLDPDTVAQTDSDPASDTTDSEESDAHDTEAVADTDTRESDAADTDAPDTETVAFGEPSEPQPPQLLWRFRTLFAEKDGASEAVQDAPDVLEEHLSHVPLVRTPRVERHIQYFQTSSRDRFDQWLVRLNHYRPLVEQIFSQFELPTDLVYLSLVESGFNPHAYSRARATGPWQFMKGTARLYGLRVDNYVDERRDPIKSTVAAARYLRDLYDLFGTWPLAMAAYNAGERKVRRALKKANAETFWELAQTRYLRRETREYVPRFIAAAIIAKNPEQYGFPGLPQDAHQFEEVVVSKPVHLRALAAATGVPYAELHRLNPELRRDVTPPSDAAYHLKVPVDTRVTIEQAVATIKPWTLPPVIVRSHNGQRESLKWHRVRAGESLSTIARRFRVPVKELKTRNNLDGRRIRPGDLLSIR